MPTATTITQTTTSRPTKLPISNGLPFRKYGMRAMTSAMMNVPAIQIMITGRLAIDATDVAHGTEAPAEEQQWRGDANNDQGSEEAGDEELELEPAALRELNERRQDESGPEQNTENDRTCAIVHAEPPVDGD